MTDKELLQLFEKPEEETEYLKFMFGDGKKKVMEKVITTEQFRTFFPRMIERDDEHWLYFGTDVEKAIGSRLSWLSYLSTNNKPFDVKYAVGETNFYMQAQPFIYEDKKYWVVTMFGQGSVSWVEDEETFLKNYILKEN